MREIKLPFGRRIADGVIVSIQSVIRGLACECACPKCNKSLVACKGEIVRSHFRHYAEVSECSQARETALHLFAKQLIVQERRLALPHDLGNICSARAELALAFGIRPDVLIEYETGETVAVEIWVSHQVETDKVQLYATHNQAALEIDLRPYRFVDEADWPRIILETADRCWIYPPLAVRLERERQRQEVIDRFRRQRAEAIEAMQQANLARLHEQRKAEAMRRSEDIRRQSEEIERAIEVERQRLADAEYYQGLVKAAEERAKTAELRAAIQERNRRERIPPDLQALVVAFGSYSAIAPEAWAQFDSERELHKQRVRSGYFYQQNEALKAASFAP